MAVDDPWIQSYFSSRRSVPDAADPATQASVDGT